MKWHNFNLSIRIKLSVGTQILIFVACVFILLGLSCISNTISAKFDAAVVALGAALGIGSLQAHGSNKLDLEAAKAGNSTADTLDKIKAAAAGFVAPCPADEGKGKQL